MVDAIKEENAGKSFDLLLFLKKVFKLVHKVFQNYMGTISTNHRQGGPKVGRHLDCLRKVK